MEEQKSFCFGVFADPHYADKDSDSERWFRRSSEKLDSCLKKFKEETIDFVVCLGDFIDYNQDLSDPVPQLREIRDKVRNCGFALYSVLGNHDVMQLPREVLRKELSLPREEGYYAFEHKGWRFVVLDTNYDPEGRAYSGKDMQWDRCVVDPKQMHWLKNELESAKGPVAVLTHGNLEPRCLGQQLDPHIVLNSKEITDLFSKSGKVKLVLQGHYHKGCVTQYEGIPYVTLRAMVEGPENNAALIVSCRENGAFSYENLF